MAKNSFRYWQIRFNQTLSNATSSDYLLILLLICVFYLIGQAWTGWMVQSPGAMVLPIVNVGLSIGGLGLWAMLLWRRLPFWLAVGSIILTLWWLTTSPIITTLNSYMAGPETYPQLLVTLVGLGEIGAVSALTQLTASRQLSQPSRFWLVLSRRTPLSSFNGMGSLVTMGFLRILRDRFFVATLTVLVLILLAKINGWPVPGSWLTITIGGMMTLAVLISCKLDPFSSSLLRKFPGLPTTNGTIDFALGITSLAILTVISWTILFGLLRLNAVDTVWLTGIFLIGQVCITLIARSSRELAGLGLLGSWWLIIIQLSALTIIYQMMWQVNLSGVMLALLIGLALFVALTSYQEPTHSATISSTW